MRYFPKGKQGNWGIKAQFSLAPPADMAYPRGSRPGRGENYLYVMASRQNMENLQDVVSMLKVFYVDALCHA